MIATGKAKELRKLPPDRQLTIIDSTAGIAAYPATFRAESIRRLRKDRKRLEATTPTRTWFEAAWVHGERLPPLINEEQREAYERDGKPHPPGWIACVGCGRHTPPNNVTSSGHCDCCEIADMSPSEQAALPSSRSACWIAGALGPRSGVDGTKE